MPAGRSSAAGSSANPGNGAPPGPRSGANSIGITDFGSNPVSGNYRYGTTEFEGQVSISNFDSWSSPYANWSSLQLNTIIPFTNTSTSQTYYYWVQDVIQVYSTSSSSAIITLLDNIWNATGYGARMYSSTVTGTSGGICQGAACGGYVPFYYYQGGLPTSCANSGNSLSVSYPAAITLTLQTGTSSGTPYVDFYFQDNAPNSVPCLFDNATFTFVNVSSPVGDWEDSNFRVSTYQNPGGFYLDTEFVWGGVANGMTAYATSANMGMSLLYLTSNGNGMQEVPSAWNYGGDTAESMGMLVDVATNGPLGGSSTAYPASLTYLNSGGSLGFLYTSADGTSFAETPTSGSVGSTPSGSGSGFAPSASMQFWAWNPATPFGTVSPAPSSACPTASDGSFASCSIAIPPLAQATVWILAGDGINMTGAQFTVDPTVGISTLIAAVGQVISITGTGLPADPNPSGNGGTLVIDANGAFVNSCSIYWYGTVGFSNTMPSGQACSYTVPPTPGGPSAIDLCLSAGVTAITWGPQCFSITVTTSLSISNSSVPQNGAIIGTALGSGFGSDDTVTLGYALSGNQFTVNGFLACTDGTYSGSGSTIQADGSGSFNCTFPLPYLSQGSYAFTAQGASGAIASASYDAAPILTVSPASGIGGNYPTSVTVTGYQFEAYAQVSVTWTGSPALSCPPPAYVWPSNPWTCTFSVPANAPDGTYVIRATESSGTPDSANATFTVGSLLSLSPAGGYPGTTVTATGIYFDDGYSNMPVTVSDTWSPGNTACVATTVTGGDFSCTFTIPDNTIAGTYSVTATDSFNNQVTVSYAISALLVLIPNPPPGHQAFWSGGSATYPLTAEGYGFDPNSPVYLELNDGTFYYLVAWILPAICTLTNGCTSQVVNNCLTSNVLNQNNPNAGALYTNPTGSSQGEFTCTFYLPMTVSTSNFISIMQSTPSGLYTLTASTYGTGGAPTSDSVQYYIGYVIPFN